MIDDIIMLLYNLRQELLNISSKEFLLVIWQLLLDITHTFHAVMRQQFGAALCNIPILLTGFQKGPLKTLNKCCLKYCAWMSETWVAQHFLYGINDQPERNK